MAEGLRDWEPEYKFHASRKWRFDFAWPVHRIAVEVEGGAFTRGRHTRPSGFIADCEKYSQAALDGWMVLRFVPMKGWLSAAVGMIKQALEVKHASQSGQ